MPDPESAGTVLLERKAELEPAPESAGQARRLLRRFLEDVGRPNWLDTGELAISEIVTNASLHAHTAMELHLVAYPDCARVEVRDFNATVPTPRQYDDEATTGRGMALVAAVTVACGVDSLGTEGKVVWFCLGDEGGRSTGERIDWGLGDWDDSQDGAWGGGGEQSCEVVLASMPATLWLSARQHHDAILRELVLHRAEHEGVWLDLTAADNARALISNALIRSLEQAQSSGESRSLLPDGHPNLRPWIPERLDLHLYVPHDAVGHFAALQDVLDVAEGLAVAGELLSRPGLPEIVAVRDWVCEQVIAQRSGIPPAPWPGTAQERFETAVHDRAGERVHWDREVVVHSDRGVIAADDANRIVAVSRPLADLLGWDPDELTGRRVVTVIPPSLREAHVAGFSRHLTTGEAHVLGVPLTLPVLRKDGSELPCRLLVERAAAGLERSIYLAWVEPVEEGDR